MGDAVGTRVPRIIWFSSIAGDGGADAWRASAGLP